MGLFLLFLLVLWAGGAFAPVSPWRERREVHLLLVAVIVLMFLATRHGGGLSWTRF
jgi:hypothetical protein